MSAPTFTLSSGCTVSLFGLFAKVSRAERVDLPVIEPHQRAPVVTALGVMMAALRRYASEPPLTEAQWEAEWMRQVGADALRLSAPHTEVAFFQSPTGEPVHPKWLSELDVTFTQQMHEQKPVVSGTPEQWVYALMASSWRQYGGRGWQAGRDGLAVVLPSADGSLSSEVALLAEAYQRMPVQVVGSSVAATCAREHLLWTRPMSAASERLPVTHCPYPCVDARAIRLIEVDGGLEARGAPNAARRVQEGAHLEDPHTPLKGGKPYRVVKNRRFDARFLRSALFGAEVVQRPRVLDLVTYRVLRVCALGTDPPGKTAGYWEALLLASPEQQAFSLLPPAPSDRAAELSGRALGALDTLSTKVLFPALAELLGLSRIPGKADSVRKRISMYIAALREAAAVPTAQAVLDLLHQPADAVAEQRTLHRTILPALAALYRQAEVTVPSRLARARAELKLEDALRCHSLSETP